ncbi:MAG: hypothetical protein QFX40_04190 [Archaeoglobales archaeon]|nr:hypothetical protein [Archaeoglobales archaeon]
MSFEAAEILKRRAESFLKNAEDLLKDFGKVLEKEKEVMEFIEANISHLGAVEAEEIS